MKIEHLETLEKLEKLEETSLEGIDDIKSLEPSSDVLQEPKSLMEPSFGGGCTCYHACGNEYARNGKCSCYTNCGSNNNKG